MNAVKGVRMTVLIQGLKDEEEPRRAFGKYAQILKALSCPRVYPD